MNFTLHNHDSALPSLSKGDDHSTTTRRRRRSTLQKFQNVTDILTSGQSVGTAFVPGEFEGQLNGYVHRGGILGVGYYLVMTENDSEFLSETPSTMQSKNKNNHFYHLFLAETYCY